MTAPEGATVAMAVPDSRRGRAFSEYLSEVRPLIDRRIGEVVSDERGKEWIGPGLQDLISRGKRMRGAFLLTTYMTFAERGAPIDTALDLAAAIEIAHSISLALDDMIDGDHTRRGRPAVHLIDGPPQTMLGMIGALSIPYSLTSRHGDEYTKLLVSTHQAMVSGEMAELRSRDDDGSEEKYYGIIGLKTGTLFSLAARFGGMAARCPSERLELLARYGMLSGIVVQIADDIDDLRSGRTRSPVRHGSEMLLARILGGPTRHGHGRIGLEARKMLEGRITEAGSVLAQALEADGGTVDPRAAERLRSAPVGMAIMMHALPTLDGSGGFGRPLKRPK